jgi:hypothetical protein
MRFSSLLDLLRKLVVGLTAATGLLAVPRQSFAQG